MSETAQRAKMLRRIAVERKARHIRVQCYALTRLSKRCKRMSGYRVIFWTTGNYAYVCSQHLTKAEAGTGTFATISSNGRNGVRLV